MDKFHGPSYEQLRAKPENKQASRQTGVCPNRLVINIVMPIRRLSLPIAMLKPCKVFVLDSVSQCHLP